MHIKKKSQIRPGTLFVDRYSLTEPSYRDGIGIIIEQNSNFVLKNYWYIFQPNWKNDIKLVSEEWITENTRIIKY